MSRAANRTARLRQLERRYLLGAYTDEEMAELMGVGSRATIFKDRQLLMDEGVPFEKAEHGRWKIDRARYLSSVRLNLSETGMLYLLARRAARQTRRPNRHVTSLLEKIAGVLRPDALTDQLVHATQQMPASATDDLLTQTLEKVVRCWVQGHKIRISYQAMHANAPRLHLISPYLIEPSLVDDGIYLIGYSETLNKSGAFKLARIMQAATTAQPIIPPPTEDVGALLREAWGVWQAAAPVTVQLRFYGAAVVRRVQETVWHPNESVTIEAADRCLWSAEVSEWREMLPWVRGWGADVAVVAPAEMRSAVMAHIYGAAVRYDILGAATMTVTNRLLRLWGKTTVDPNEFHPALYHMLDVGHVAQALLQSPASPRWRRVLGDVLGTDPDRLHEWLPWLIALHDIGKLTVPFQVQNKAQRQRLRAEGFDFGGYQGKYHRQLYHTVAGRLALRPWLTGQAFDPRLATALEEMLTGHHGWYGFINSDHRGAWQVLAEPAEWPDMRESAVALLADWLHDGTASAARPPNVSAAIAALNGFTILCDWLGSDSAYFAPHPHTAPEVYRSLSQQAAQRRVAAAGLLHTTTSTAPADFAALFGFAPRPLQAAIEHIPDDALESPSLTIIEAPTGEGKTEAALTLAHRIGRLRGHDELYIALPTTATSNAMFGRIQRYLTEGLGLPNLVKLVHGQDFLESELRIEQPLTNEGDPAEHPALAWFAPRKQALLAPFGVGTVDQAELSALSVKHNALRQIGLAGKVVILDEVHAYDTYMSTIIAGMLAWLAAHGTSVILLSATLPAAQRQRLAEGYLAGLPAAARPVLPVAAAYPAILHVGMGDARLLTPPAYQPGRTLDLTLLAQPQEEWAAVAQALLAAVADGGCACYIANTVGRAQALCQALQGLADGDLDLTLLHARFPLEQRQALEQRVLARYGKQGDAAQRPVRGIVVGTQVLEQSLDLDFDIMFSDLAPIDLLLQRAGRLHRHADRTNRAPGQTAARLVVRYLVDATGDWRPGVDRFYAELVMRRTLALLQARAAHDGVLRLPADYRPLIEAVYDETPPAADDPLRAAWQKLETRKQKLRGEAAQRLTGNPDAEEPFTVGKLWHFEEGEEDDRATDWAVAQTRYSELPSITVIPLERVDDATAMLPDGTPIPLDAPADRALQLRLRRRQVPVSNRQLVPALTAQPLPALFAQSALLKHCVPLLLHGGRAALPTPHPVTVVLDPALGLMVASDSERRAS